MCGRFVIGDNYQSTEKVDYGFKVGKEFERAMKAFGASYSIAPTNQVPVVTGEHVPSAAWGFKRVFSGKKQNIINTRIDRLATARTWKRPYLDGHRIIIPMTGYYEWVARKQPWYITANQPLWVAGLIETKDDGNYFTMVTTEGTDEAGRVHDRMPAFITSDLRDDWLGGEVDESGGQALVDELEDSAQSIAKSLKAWAVSQRVNTVRVDKSDASLIEKV